MIALLVLAAIAPSERWQRLRVGAVMLGASFIAAIYPNIWFYLCIELAAGFLILLPPKSTWQQWIGSCYIGMAILTIGFVATLQFFSSANGNSDMLKVGYDLFAWIAAGFLFLWGIDGLLEPSRNASRGVGCALAHRSSPKR